MPKAKKKKGNYSKKRKPFGEEFMWLLLLGLWIVGIFFASSVEGSGEQYFDLRIIIERKGAHVLEFFVLAYLFFKILNFQKISFEANLILTFILASLYAASDEFHQLFVFGREGKLSDVAIDGAGIIIFLLLAFVLKKIQHKKPRLCRGLI